MQGANHVTFVFYFIFFIRLLKNRAFEHVKKYLFFMFFYFVNFSKFSKLNAVASLLLKLRSSQC
jgi:hypothetical protein